MYHWHWQYSRGLELGMIFVLSLLIALVNGMECPTNH
jgi:hypothetical protein